MVDHPAVGFISAIQSQLCPANVIVVFPGRKSFEVKVESWNVDQYKDCFEQRPCDL